MIRQDKPSNREQIEQVANESQHVAFNPRQTAAVAAIMQDNIKTRWWMAYHEADVRYQLRPAFHSDEADIMFNFINMAQMFLIWEWTPDGDVRPWHLHIDGQLMVGASSITAAHCRAIRRGQDLLDPSYLAQMQLSDVEDVYRDEQTNQVTLQNLPGRLAKFNEMGRVLLQEFDGSVLNLVARAGGRLYSEDKSGIIQLLARHFPISYGDEPFYKLANLFPLFLYNMRQAHPPRSPEFMRLTNFEDFAAIEGGADYYRPLFLLRVGVIDPDETLRELLAERKLIPRDSRLEREIRAHTLQSLRALTNHVGVFPHDLDGVEVETHAQAFLRCRHCRVGISDEELFCPYKPICPSYNGGYERMEMCWPLVETTAY